MYSEIVAPLEENKTAKTQATLDDSARALVEEHLPMVKSIVQSMCAQFPSHADTGEMHSLGVMGLIEAARRYDASHGRSFAVYASVRIRGSVLDELRRLDWMPRTARKRSRMVDKVVQKLEQELGRAPNDTEIREELNMDIKTFRRVQRQISQLKFFSLDAQSAPAGKTDGDMDMHNAIPDDRQMASNEQTEKSEMIELMKKTMTRLPERYQEILKMYYFKNMRLSEIATIYQVSEARICQIHTQAVKRMGTMMRQMV